MIIMTKITTSATFTSLPRTSGLAFQVGDRDRVGDRVRVSVSCRSLGAAGITVTGLYGTSTAVVPNLIVG